MNGDFFIDCYSKGAFPMAEGRYEKNVFFFKPNKRGVIPLDKVNISKSLIRSIKKKTMKSQLTNHLKK